MQTVQLNHPDFVGIIPILLENPESRPICDRDRKNPDFDSCCDIFVKFSQKKSKDSVIRDHLLFREPTETFVMKKNRSVSGWSPVMAVTNSISSCFILVFALYVHHRINALSISDVDTTYLTNGVQFSNKISHNIRENVAFHHYSRRLGDNMARNSNILFSMLPLCGDVMENPGPSVNEDSPNRFTCGLCSLDVSWKDRGLCCDNCDRWFHRHCQNPVDIHESPESDYIIGGVAWSCVLCGCPNYSTIFSYHTVDVSNRFEQL